MYSPARLALLIPALVLALSACSTSEDRDLQRLPQYQAGYNDGCRTALDRGRGFAAEITRNKAAFDQDSAYRAGWRDGSMNCGPNDGLGRNPTFDDPQIGPAPL